VLSVVDDAGIVYGKSTSVIGLANESMDESFNAVLSVVNDKFAVDSSSTRDVGLVTESVHGSFNAVQCSPRSTMLLLCIAGA